MGIKGEHFLFNTEDITLILGNELLVRILLCSLWESSFGIPILIFRDRFMFCAN